MLRLTVIVLYFAACTANPCTWHAGACVYYCPPELVKEEITCDRTVWPTQRTCQNPALQFRRVRCGDSQCECPNDEYYDIPTGTCNQLIYCPEIRKEWAKVILDPERPIPIFQNLAGKATKENLFTLIFSYTPRPPQEALF